jgi:uncharacterized membrane protein
MSVTTAIVALWVGFAVTHIVPTNPRLRPRLIGALGERGYQGVYSLVSFALFVPLVWVYIANRHAGPELYNLQIGTVLEVILNLVMIAAFVLLVAGVRQPSPASIASSGDSQVKGAHRLSRHPVFMALGLYGLLHLFARGNAASVAFFAGFPIFAIIGCLHQDRRKLETGGETFKAWYEQTPFFPFTGRETVRGIRELGWVTPAIGIAIALGLRALHGPVFG